jgi:hypothetical protein
MSFVCDVCGGTFTTKQTLDRHISNPSKLCNRLRERLPNQQANSLPRPPFVQAGATQHQTPVENENTMFAQYLGTPDHNLNHLHELLRPSHTAVSNMLEIARTERSKIHEHYQQKFEETNQKIIYLTQRFGLTQEEINLLNYGLDNESEPCLSRMRELMLLKIEAIDVLLIKRNERYNNLKKLEYFFAKKLLRNIRSEYEITGTDQFMYNHDQTMMQDEIDYNIVKPISRPREIDYNNVKPMSRPRESDPLMAVINQSDNIMFGGN